MDSDEARPAEARSWNSTEPTTPAGGQEPDPEQVEEHALIEAILAGQASAIERFVARYQSFIFGICLRMMGHRQDAEDVTQDILLRALRGLPGFQSGRPLRPWLMGITANRCRTALARRAKRPASVEMAQECVDPRPGLDDPEDLVGELERALQQLRPQYRMVVVMFHEQGLAYDEISEAIKRPVGTVKTWLHRARAELATILADRGVELPGKHGRATASTNADTPRAKPSTNPIASRSESPDADSADPRLNSIPRR